VKTLASLALHAARGAMALQGFSSRFVDTPRGRLHVYEARGTGRGPTLVVLHGFGSSAPAFGRVMRMMLPHVERVLAPELPGHGFSEDVSPMDTPTVMALLVAALDQLLEKPAVVFGNSLGGAAALRVALALPRKVGALVLGSPGGARMDEAELRQVMSNFNLRTNDDARVLLHKLFHQAPWFTPLMPPVVRGLFARAPIRALMGTIRVEDLLTPEELQSLTMPILLMWGRSEKLLPPHHLEFFRRNLPSHAVVEEPEQFGHCPQLDRPHLLAARLQAFVQGLPQA
jgi:pimeloyl-ACP methyl ester carboxylesterase